MSGIQRIDVEERLTADDWMAYLNGDRKLWGCGRTQEAAIGSAILGYYHLVPEGIHLHYVHEETVHIGGKSHG